MTIATSAIRANSPIAPSTKPAAASRRDAPRRADGPPGAEPAGADAVSSAG
jgi:hypothetical protein